MKVLAVVIIVMALVVGVVPQFTNCFHEGKTVALANGTQAPMKCLWTAMGELAMAVPVLGVGAMLTISRQKETRRGLAVLGVILGAFVIALPTQLIGVCSHPDATCNMVMKPAMIFAGAVVMAASVGILLISERKTGESA
jgi:hypothetical protein